MRQRLAGLGLALTLVAGVIAATATPAQAESNGGVRVMPLGDSITDGYNVPGGYRINLWQRLVAGGYTVDFVGSGFNGPASLGDHDHEGHSGWRIDQIDANIVSWLRTYTPRTILLHIGTNDMNQNYDVGNAPARLSALIDQIRANAPDVERVRRHRSPRRPTRRWRRGYARTTRPSPASSPSKGAEDVHLVDMHARADHRRPRRRRAPQRRRATTRWPPPGTAPCGAVPGSLQPPASTGPPVGVAVSLVNPQSARCADVSGASTAAGAQIHIWDCHNGANQKWTRTAANELRVYGNRCLDVNGNGTANGTKIQIWDCNGTGAQKFTFQPNGSILVPASGKCLDVTASGTANGTKVQLYTCNGTGAQRWTTA